MLVDSCLDQHQRPAALAYLKSIGVSLSKVKLIVATHWHDDHVGGLAKVVKACSSADFAYSGALQCKEFFELVGSLSERAQVQRSGVSEFAEVTKVLEERMGISPKLAVESRRLWFRSQSKPAAFVESLSPCDEAVLRSQQALAALLPQPNTSKRAVAAPKPNHASVALWVGVGDIRLLLGADLEETKKAKSGWTAILDTCQLDGAPASVFKIPHHGSANADQPRVWNEALISEPWALTTPFVRGNQKLPQPSDRQRIRSQTPNAFLTARSERTKRKRSPAVETTLALVDASPVIIDPTMGQIRLRRTIGQDGPWREALFGPAFQFGAKKP